MLILTNKKKKLWNFPSEEVISVALVRHLREEITRIFPPPHYAHSAPITLISTNLKDKLVVLFSFILTSSFVRSCSARYVGKATCQLSQSIREHKTVFLKRKPIVNAIVDHIADTGPQLNDEAFKVIYRVPEDSLKIVRQLHFATAESTAIRLLNPSLCSQNVVSNHFSYLGRERRILVLPQVPLTVTFHA